MDLAIQRIAQEMPDQPSVVQLTGIYHSLMRQWANL
jgi:PKHD-type hydroxylase